MTLCTMACLDIKRTYEPNRAHRQGPCPNGVLWFSPRYSRVTLAPSTTLHIHNPTKSQSTKHNTKPNQTKPKTNKINCPHSGVYCGGNLTASSLNPLNPLSCSSTTGAIPISVEAPPNTENETSEPERGRSAVCMLPVPGKTDVDGVAGRGTGPVWVYLSSLRVWEEMGLEEEGR